MRATSDIMNSKNMFKKQGGGEANKSKHLSWFWIIFQHAD